MDGVVKDSAKNKVMVGKDRNAHDVPLFVLQRRSIFSSSRFIRKIGTIFFQHPVDNRHKPPNCRHLRLVCPFPPVDPFVRKSAACQNPPESRAKPLPRPPTAANDSVPFVILPLKVPSGCLLLNLFFLLGDERLNLVSHPYSLIAYRLRRQLTLLKNTTPFGVAICLDSEPSEFITQKLPPFKKTICESLGDNEAEPSD